MSGSSLGRLLRVTTFGESHGSAVGCVLDGCPPGLPITPEVIQRDLDRRRPGQSRLVTPRGETDRVEILSGVFEGVTLGTPIALLVRNQDADSSKYEDLRTSYRPSHADYTTDARYGVRDWRGGGRASARETVGRVAAGAVARVLLAHAGIDVVAWVESVADVDAVVDPLSVTMEAVDATPVRCPDPVAAAAMIDAIDAARKDRDTVGGVVGCVARGVPAGLGEPVFDKLEAELARAMMSIPAAKGFESGSGFGGTRMRGSVHNDPFTVDAAGRVVTESNHSGGIQGGITNGMPVTMRIAFKPVATHFQPQRTVTVAPHQATTLQMKGRHDPCVLPRAVPIVEAMACLVIADHLLRIRAIRAV